MPIDNKTILKLHTDFGSLENIEQMLIKQVLTKSVYMTGPLMSSKESAAERRNDLLSFIEDQSINGVYKTKQVDKKIIDELEKEKIVTIVEIIKDNKGMFLRNEKSLVRDYGVSLQGLALNSIYYSDDVEKQIKLQQNLTMQVQTSIANAKKSIQDAITTEQKGKADAAKAKWDQEVIKAKLVTEAQQKKEIAYLESQTAQLNAKTVRTDADAQSYANAKLVAAGLSPLDRAEYDMKTKIGVAEALSKIQLPSTYFSGSTGNGGASMLESILGAKLLDLSPKK